MLNTGHGLCFAANQLYISLTANLKPFNPGCSLHFTIVYAPTPRCIKWIKDYIYFLRMDEYSPSVYGTLRIHDT